MIDLHTPDREPRHASPMTHRAGGRMMVTAIVLLFAVLLGAWCLFTSAQEHALKAMAAAGPTITDDGK